MSKKAQRISRKMLVVVVQMEFKSGLLSTVTGQNLLTYLFIVA